jgi:hypothetical protein
VPVDVHDSSLTRVRPFFEALFARDPSGRSWLSALLGAAPNGRAALGELVDQPGYLSTLLAVRAMSGRLAAFEYPVAATRELLSWYIEHPERLRRPANVDQSPGADRLRRALLDDDPPGARTRAQERARELVRSRSPTADEWWRFEGVDTLDCMLITDRLVVTVTGKRGGPLAPATEWYPQRSELVRNLEAARHYAQGKRWGSLLISEHEIPEAATDALAASLPQAAPHLDDAGRDELRRGYLGNLTWEQACAAVGVPFDSLPDTTG